MQGQASDNQATGQVLGGSEKAPVKIEVFSDFQCPACRELYLNTIVKILQEYPQKDRVRVIYHEFPLKMHKYSRQAARYSEAASRLGRQKLLPVMEVLFTDQAQWGLDGNIDASVSKVLSSEDLKKLKRIMEDSSIDTRIEEELQLGQTKEIKSTPTLILTYPGKQQKKEGYISYPIMKQFLDTILD